MTDDRPYRGLFGGQAPQNTTTSYLSKIINELSAPPSDRGLGDALSALNMLSSKHAPPQGGLLSAIGSPVPTLLGGYTEPNALGGLFALGEYAQSLERGRDALSIAERLYPYMLTTPAPLPLPDVRRRTFFSFHFLDSFRVNQVRQSWRIRPKTKDPRAPLWFRDSSLWEKLKKPTDLAIKREILSGLDRTSVTCILAGEHTWTREWVRFEIAASVRRGNALLTVYVDGLECPNQGFCNRGHNPLDAMGIYKKPNGLFYLCQKDDNGTWVQYDKIDSPVRWPPYLSKPSAVNAAVALSTGAWAYDYYAEDGYKNMSAWIQSAAVRSGK